MLIFVETISNFLSLTFGKPLSVVWSLLHQWRPPERHLPRSVPQGRPREATLGTLGFMVRLTEREVS